MHANDDPLFDVVYTLPVLSYSVALAQRSPASGWEQSAKFMPDYGGYLETTTSRLKNNALASGIPFDTKPERTRIEFVNSIGEASEPVVSSNESLIVTSYLESDKPEDLSVIRLLGSNITFDTLKRVPGDRCDTQQYGHISSKRNRDPRGLKHIKANNDDYLLVKYSKSIKVHELNRSFNCDASQDQDSAPDQSTHKQISSINDRTGHSVRDASLSTKNSNILGIASDNSNIHSIRLFDLSTSRRRPFQTIEWATLDNEFPSIDRCLLSKELRGRVVRTFIPIQPTNYGTQQLDHIPSHLVNLLVTNEHRISLVDPRSESLAQNFMVKAEVPSFYPVEYLRRTVFSEKNDYQLYSMTNVHLRVIDTRYPGIPVAQIGHMLEPQTYDAMNLTSVAHPECFLETLCCSSACRISFITFDQSDFGQLINPRSIHLPYHDSSLNDNTTDGDVPAFGLRAIAARRSNHDELFSLFQLSSQGDLLLRSYSGANALDLEQSLARVNLMAEEEQARSSKNSTHSVPIHQPDEMPFRNALQDRGSPPQENLIDLQDSSFIDELENRLEAKRAQEKFEFMKNKLCRI